jgi:hypothetical protein
VVPTPEAATGVRGSITFDGYTAFTASPGWLTYEMLLPTDDILTVPVVFGENKDDATLDVFMDDALILTVSGADYDLDALSLLDLNIAGKGGQTVELRFVIDTEGAERANIFIPNSLISVTPSTPSAVPVPGAVWLFGSGLIGLIASRRNKA